MNLLLSIILDVVADSSLSVPKVNELTQSLISGELQQVIVEGCISLMRKLLFALFVFYVGKFLIGKIRNIVFLLLEKKGVEQSLSTFCRSLVNVLLYFILIIIIIDILGLETSSFVALFASAGVAIGMALSGTLQNFAGGVMILLFRPFKVGDYISAQSNEGVVKEIQIFNTIISTSDGKTVIMPNGSLSTNVLVNFSKAGVRRIDWTISMAYGDEVDLAKQTIYDILNGNEKILKEPAVYVAVKGLNSSSVDFVAMGWVKTADYWSVMHAVNEAVYIQFSKKGINIPFPQMDVHIVGEK